MHRSWTFRGATPACPWCSVDFDPVTPPPLPPHERPWRHPSELPAPAHEPPTRSGRLLIVTTAAVGLALVGVMAVRMTPGQTPQRDALRSVSTSVLTGVSTTSLDDVAGAAATTGRRFTDVVGRTLSSMVATTNRSAVRVSTSSAPAQLDVRFAVVTPIGDDGLGITTAAAVEGRSGVIEAMLPTGAVVSAELLGTDDGVALVQLATPPSETAAFVGATDKEWTVVAYGDEHVVDEEGDDLMALELPEAAPIFDADGDLVGLCTIGPNGIEVLRVTSLPDVPTPPVTESSEPATTVATSEPTDSSGPPPGETDSTEAPASTAPGSTIASSSLPVTDSSAVATSEPSATSTPPSSDVPTT